MNKVPMPGVGISLASNSNKDPDNGFYDEYSRPRELVELGIQWMLSVYIIPVIQQQGVDSVIFDMPGGKKNIVGDYPYRDWEMRDSPVPSSDIPRMRGAISSLSTHPSLNEILLYQGFLGEPNMSKLMGWFFTRAAYKPITPFADNPKVSFIFDATNRSYITKNHRISKFLERLKQRIGSGRVIREALPGHPDQYGQASFIKINAYRQFTNFPAAAKTGPIHLYWDSFKMVGTVPIPGETDLKFATLAHWCAWCFKMGYRFSIAEHVLRALDMTFTQVRDEAQAIVDAEGGE